MDFSETFCEHTREGELVGSNFVQIKLLLLFNQVLQILLINLGLVLGHLLEFDPVGFNFVLSPLHVGRKGSAEAFQLLLQT